MTQLEELKSKYMKFEIVNPSDNCSLKAENFGIAVCACVLLGQGKYGLKGKDNENIMPVFLIGGFDEWWSLNFSETLEDYIKNNMESIVSCLESVRYKANRTSVNNIKCRGLEIASFLKKKYLELSKLKVGD